MAGEQGYANPAALVSTEWVAEHMNDPDVRLLEVDVDTTAYDQGHLPGAVGLNWTTQLSDRDAAHLPGRRPGPVAAGLHAGRAALRRRPGRQGAGRRALAGRVPGRDHRPAGPAGDGPALRPHPGGAERALGP